MIATPIISVLRMLSLLENRQNDVSIRSQFKEGAVFLIRRGSQKASSMNGLNQLQEHTCQRKAIFLKNDVLSGGSMNLVISWGL